MPGSVDVHVEEFEAPHEGVIEPATPTRELTGRLAGLSLTWQVLVLSAWPLLEQFMSFLVGTVDLAMAGRLRPEAVAVVATDAMGLAAYLQWLIAMIYSSVGVGSGALIARAIGGRHRRVANAALGQALLIGVGLGLLTGLLIWTASPMIVTLSGLGTQAAELAVMYLRIISLTTPAAAVLLVGNAALRAAGDTRTPFAVMLVVNIVNIAASITLVFGPAPLGGHGVAGIAAGTAIAWAVGCVLVLFVLIRGYGGIRLRLIRLRPHGDTAWRIVRVGSPNLAESFFGMWLANFIVLRIVAGLDTSEPGTVGAHMIGIRVESLSFLAGFAFATAAATLAGQYLGLGDPHRARKAVAIAWGFAAAIMGIMGIFFLAIPEVFIHVITDSPRLVDLSTPLLRICGPVQIFFATSMVLAGAMRGAGDTAVTFKLTVFSIFFVRVSAVVVMGPVLGWGLTGVWLALCGELVVRAGIFAARFLHGGWTRVAV